MHKHDGTYTCVRCHERKPKEEFRYIPDTADKKISPRYHYSRTCLVCEAQIADEQDRRKKYDTAVKEETDAACAMARERRREELIHRAMEDIYANRRRCLLSGAKPKPLVGKSRIVMREAMRRVREADANKNRLDATCKAAKKAGVSYGVYVARGYRENGAGSATGAKTGRGGADC